MSKHQPLSKCAVVLSPAGDETRTKWFRCFFGSSLGWGKGKNGTNCFWSTESHLWVKSWGLFSSHSQEQGSLSYLLEGNYFMLLWCLGSLTRGVWALILLHSAQNKKAASAWRYLQAWSRKEATRACGSTGKASADQQPHNGLLVSLKKKQTHFFHRPGARRVREGCGRWLENYRLQAST